MRILLIIFLFVFSTNSIQSQVVINEVVSSNHTGIADEDGDTPDWIELYNTSNNSINLEGYILKDRWEMDEEWTFPSIEIEPKSFLLVYASGKNRKNVSFQYKTIIEQGDEWQYFVTDHSLPQGDWRVPGYDASGWQSGPSGFGYGDNDDNTLIQPLVQIYIRKEFIIENLSALQEILLHVDYDDGFIAFINGVPVAMNNVNVPGDNNFDNIQCNGQREATIYQGAYPEAFSINLETVPLIEGTNLIAIQGYNTSSGSSDFSLIPFLTLGSTSFSYTDVSEYVQVDQGGGLHTNFNINIEGEPLILQNKQRQTVDSIYLVPLIPDVSFGRYPDGSEDWSYFMEPTPAAPNINPVPEIISDTVFFSPSPGFYSQRVDVVLETNDPGVVIRYTTDGSEPDSNSRRYNSPVPVAGTRVIRTAAFRNGTRDRDIFAATYFINKNHDLPVISISANPKDLFDYHEGILVEGPNAQPQDPKYGANYWMDWEKRIHFEYFDENNTRQLNQMAGLKVFGGWSRMSAQKSMSVFARNIYRNNRFNYKIFKEHDFDEIKTFILRNSGNDWHYTMLRDGYVSEVVKDINIDRLSYQPAVIYLNGEYWGILNIREKTNEHYLHNNHGVDPDNVNRLESDAFAMQGTNNRYREIISFIEDRSLAGETNYSYVASRIDIEEFINYQLVQIYINNRDWPGNNIKYWNTNSKYSKWRWILYDTDFGLGLYNNRGYTENTIEFATAPNNTGWPNPSWSTLLLRKLLTNDGFRIQFINRMADLMNTTFEPKKMNSILDSVASTIESEIGSHQSKWGRNYSQWQNNIDVIPEFNYNRPDYVRQHFQQYFNLNNSHNLVLSVSNPLAGKIKVNTIIPNEYPFRGKYFSNVPLTFEAIAKPGYKFVKWSDASGSNYRKLTMHIEKSTNLHAIFEEDDGIVTDIVINEINYRSHEENDAGDWIELYNRGNQTVDLSNWRLVDSNASNMFMFPPGLQIYPGDYLVVSSDLSRFKHVYPNVKNVTGSFNFGLSSSGDLIELLDRTFNLINSVFFKTESPWPTEPLTTNSTLELIDPYLDNTLHINWQAGPDGGTPGKANSNYEPSSVQLVTKQVHGASCFPVKFSDFTTLRFYSPGYGESSIQILDISGRVKKSLNGKLSNEGTQYIDIFTNETSYAPGIHFIKLTTPLGTETLKVIKK